MQSFDPGSLFAAIFPDVLAQIRRNLFENFRIVRVQLSPQHQQQLKIECLTPSAVIAVIRKTAEPQMFEFFVENLRQEKVRKRNVLDLGNAVASIRTPVTVKYLPVE